MSTQQVAVRSAPVLVRLPTAAATSSARRPARARRLLGPSILLLVIGVTAFGLYRHVMWFDELQAWNIARASRSIPDLFHNLRYEGHPVVWYLLLFVLTRITGDPRAMQVLELGVVAVTAALILFRSPFALAIRMALISGYFISFEYGVISRSYGIGVLFLLVALVSIGRPQPAWLAGFVAVTLLAWTTLLGAVAALALAGAVALGAAPWTRRQPRARPDRRRLAFVVGVVLAAAGSAISCRPPRGFRSFNAGLLGASSGSPVERLVDAAAATWRALAPIPTRLGAWNSQLLDGRPGARWIEAGISLVIICTVIWALRPFPFASRLWALGSVGYFIFYTVVISPHDARYAGQVFLLLVACVWLALAPPGGRALDDDGGVAADGDDRASRGDIRHLVGIFAAVLAAQVAAMLMIFPSATIHRFASNRAIARAAASAHLGTTLVSGADFDATSIGGYLDHPVYSVARHAWIRFFTHDALEAGRYDRLTSDEIVAAARRVVAARGRAAGVIVTRALPEGLPGVRQIATAGTVLLYRVDRVT